MEATLTAETLSHASRKLALRWRTPKSAAEHLEMSERTLERMRATGGGPRFSKCGRQIRYRDDWIDDWLEKRSFTSTRAARAANCP